MSAWNFHYELGLAVNAKQWLELAFFAKCYQWLHLGLCRLIEVALRTRQRVVSSQRRPNRSVAINFRLAIVVGEKPIRQRLQDVHFRHFHTQQLKATV